MKLEGIGITTGGASTRAATSSRRSSSTSSSAARARRRRPALSRPRATDRRARAAGLLIFANKQDLPNALSPEEISEHLNLGSAQYANRHWEIQSCSARTGDGLVKGIDWMVDDVASRIMLR